MCLENAPLETRLGKKSDTANKKRISKNAKNMQPKAWNIEKKLSKLDCRFLMAAIVINTDLVSLLPWLSAVFFVFLHFCKIS